MSRVRRASHAPPRSFLDDSSSSSSGDSSGNSNGNGAESSLADRASHAADRTEGDGVQHGRYSTEFKEVVLLGRGGFGSVYLVQNRLDLGMYAVKKIRFRRRGRDGRLGTKLLREVRALQCLAHPNIVRYHSSWVDCGA